jgi:hypothetical protein
LQDVKLALAAGTGAAGRDDSENQLPRLIESRGLGVTAMISDFETEGYEWLDRLFLAAIALGCVLAVIGQRVERI